MAMEPFIIVPKTAMWGNGRQTNGKELVSCITMTTNDTKGSGKQTKRRESAPSTGPMTLALRETGTTECGTEKVHTPMQTEVLSPESG